MFIFRNFLIIFLINFLMSEIHHHHNHGHNNEFGIAVGVTSSLTKKYNAVELVKLGSSVIGGMGGAGRNDFAQAGGKVVTKITESFNSIVKLIK